jgi:hypothetical protein
MPERVPDLPRLLNALAEHGCEYVLIGGMAAVMHGSAEVTFDCDLAVAFSAENRHRLVEALAPFHPRPVRRKSNQFVWDEKDIVSPWTLLETDLGRVDLIVRLPGIDSFRGLFERSVTAEFQGVTIRYASLDDLLAMKTAADRGKDSAQLAYLRSLKQMES